MNRTWLIYIGGAITLSLHLFAVWILDVRVIEILGIAAGAFVAIFVAFRSGIAYARFMRRDVTQQQAE